MQKTSANETTRRQFLWQALRLGALTTFGVGALTAIFAEKISLPVETREGHFHLNLYGHGLGGILVPSPVKEEDFPPRVDAVFLEGFPADENEIFQGYIRSSDGKEPQTPNPTPLFESAALTYAFRHEIPIYQGDPHGARGAPFFLALSFAPIAAEIASTAYLEKMAKKIVPRRKFLAGLAAGAACFYATEPGIYLTRLLNPLIINQPWARTVRELANRSEELHRFEDFLMVFRNAEMSYKLLDIAKRLKEAGKPVPEITAILGQHSGIEYWLKQGEKRCLQVMREYPKPILETIFGLDGQECARRISATLEINLASEGKFNPSLILYQDQELFTATGGEGIITPEKEIKIAEEKEDERKLSLLFRGKERI